MRQRCPVCRGVLQRGQSICTLDVLFLARQASRAYDEIRQRDPSLSVEARITAAIAWIESGHERHRSPHLGCPFCRIPTII